MDFSKMDALIDSWQGEMIDMLRGWLAIDSVQAEKSADNAPFGDNVRRMLDLFLADAGKLGFEVDDVDGYAGSAQMGEGSRTLGILAHLDIVPAGDGWTRDPFGGEIADGMIYGRGVQDDKGPALMALYAMRAVREAGIPLKDAVRLIVGCDEETGMSDMRYYAKTRKMPDYGFSPDAEFPLINIEKGGLALKLSSLTGGEDGALIPVYSLNAGLRRNVVPGYATAEIGCASIEFDEIKKRVESIAASHEGFDLRLKKLDGERALLESFGKQGHAAMPELGFNAAGALLVALDELEAGGGSKTAIQGLSRILGVKYDGDKLGIKQSDDLSGPLTCNLGILRYDGREISVVLDIRYPLCASEDDMCKNAGVAAAPWGLKVEHIGGHTPLHVPADNPVVTGLLEVYRDMTGITAKPLAIGGGTYSRMMPNTVAFGVTFPGDVDRCHMPDECYALDKFMLCVRMMAQAIVKLAG
ncbi:MAG: Sapep family Mn(2+)-dependent dipeptidase [Clostridia bacterium]|nr:Sapep family Mn(2+)-dependent dipeptidase [Clostridia bacterium]